MGPYTEVLKPLGLGMRHGCMLLGVGTRLCGKVLSCLVWEWNRTLEVVKSLGLGVRGTTGWWNVGILLYTVKHM